MANDSLSQLPSSDSLPPLAALFLIKFDLKVGYTIAWKQSLPNVPLEGVVEYKSLPSGLHNVKEDLVYFVHEQWAGVSAFRNAEAEERERGARFLSVGALVSIGDGRLGRCWEYARQLKELAEELVENQDNVDMLADFWEKHKSSGEDAEGSQDPASPTVAKRRNRGLSSLTLAPNQQTLPDHHPAYSILGYLDTFGPLSFALHRAALLRKRILIITPAPVRAACEYVYDLSILSSLPHSLSYTPTSPTMARLQPLFNVGIHDIPYLTSLSKSPQPTSETSEEETLWRSTGYVACTTDEILAMKPDLYDVLVELPHPDRFGSTAGPGRRPKNKGAGAQRWPSIKLSITGEEIKASQRDLRRYRSVRRALAPLTRINTTCKYEDGPDENDDDDDEETHLLFSSIHGALHNNGEEEAQHRADEEKVTEKTSWSEVAYSSFMWWASAGEREEGLKEEDEQDAALLGSLPEIVMKEDEGRRDKDADTSPSRCAEIEMAVIAYFHRISKAIFDTTEAVLEEREQADGAVEEEEGDEDGRVEQIESEDLRRCGLDVWSNRDRGFIVEFVDLWFEKEVEVRGVGVECCGMRIC